MTSSNYVDQTPPCAPDSERAIIAAIFVDPSLIAPTAERLNPSRIFMASHREAYQALVALNVRGISIDPIQLKEELRERGTFEQIGGEAFLATLMGGLPSEIHHHIDRIIETANKRRLSAIATGAAQAAYNGHTSAQVVQMLRELVEEYDHAEKKADQVEQPLLNVVRMADVQAQKISWLWPNRIALRAITILEGIEGEGKSTPLAALTAGITRGRGLPETEPGEPGSVVWLSAEDDLSQVLKPRLESAGADCDRVFAIGEPFTLDEKGLLGLRQAIANHEPQLVVIDPIFAYTRGDANKGNDARSLTGELKKIADQFDCAIVLVRHVGKSKGLGDPRAAGLYSIEWRAAARSVLLAGADPDNPQKRALTQTKNNLGPKSDSIGYMIESDSSSPSGARFFWTGASDLTAERILSPLTSEGEEETAGRREATDFLREALSDGPRAAKDIQSGARQCGISERTLNRAKAALGIQSRKEGGTFGGRQSWLWELPAEGCQIVTEGCHSLEGGNLQVNRGDKSSYINSLTEDCQLPESGNLQADNGNLQTDFDSVSEAIDR